MSETRRLLVDFNTLYPNPFHLNMHRLKARMLLGNRWIEVGNVVVTGDKFGMTIETPNVQYWLASREHLDDGTLEWAAWGPRMN